MRASRRLITALFALFLAGCASYVWEHPSKPVTQWHADKLDCEDEALRRFPIVIVQRQTGGGYHKPPTSKCVTSDGTTTCQSTAGRFVPPTYQHDDVNESARENTTRDCLGALGWIRRRVD